MKIAHLAQPGDKIAVKMLMALGADVNSFAQTIIVESQGGPSGIEIFGEGSQDLTFPGFDNVAPKPCGMEVAGGKCAFKRQMVLFTLGQLIEFDDLEAKQIGEVMWVAGIGRHVMFVD